MGDVPSRYIVFDTETYETILSEEPRHVSLKFRLGVAKLCERTDDGEYYSTYHNLYSPEDLFWLIDSLAKHKSKTWVFAHNLGFDLRIVGLFKEIASGRYRLINPSPNKRSRVPDGPFVVLDDPPTIIRLYRPDGAEFLWLDTWQWLSNSLAEIGRKLGNAKGDMPALSASDDEWFSYCRQDVDVLDDAMRRVFRFISDNEYHAFHPTRAGQAKLIYTKIYEKKRIKYHNDPEIQAVERPSYYGGFTECFRVGEIPGTVHQLDVNSLYPYVMKRYWYPAEVHCTSLDGADTTPFVALNPKRCIAEVYLDARTTPYPLRCKEGTVFVNGKVRTILPGPELAAAFSRGDVVKTTNFVSYTMEPLFSEFVDDMYTLRLKAKAEGNDIFDYFYKLILNSLYGKFGQLTAEWEWVGETDPATIYAQGHTIDAESGEIQETRVLAGTTYRRARQTDHPKSFVSIASYVTSYAREYMRSIRESIPRGSYYYQATDSLYVSDPAYHQLQSDGLINPLELGHLKHEASYPNIHIYNIHNMDKGDKRVRGSIRSKAVHLGGDRYRQESWESLLPGIKSGHVSEVHIRTVEKELTHRYDRQLVDHMGGCIPHVVDNWDVPPAEQSNRWLFRRG